MQRARGLTKTRLRQQKITQSIGYRTTFLSEPFVALCRLGSEGEVDAAIYRTAL
jgi:hypothetical protein